MTLDELIVRIRVAADGMDGELDDVLGDLRRFASEAEGSSKSSSEAQAAAWAGLAAAAGVAFGKIVGAIQTGIEASNQYKAAITGLDSVAQAHGIGSAAMEGALAGVTDEFFSAAAAATAFKNLLSRGYTLDQATNTIRRLKDAAAFGRQASYGLADAVVSATEGIKNENSVLVDNAGVTKNVAKMWEDYAKARGVATASLTQGQKVEAEYLGIMEETKAQMGDLGKLSEGLAGAQAEAANQSQLLAQSFGDAMTPMVQELTEGFTGLLSGLTGVAEAAPGATAGITAMTTAFLGLIGVKAAVSGFFALMKNMALTNPFLLAMAGVAVVVGVVTAAITAGAKAQEAIAKEEEDRRRAVRESVTAEQTRLDRLRELKKRYEELRTNSARTVDENAELASLVQELSDKYGIQAEKVNAAAEAQERLNKAMADAEVNTLADLYQTQNDATWDSIHAAQDATKGIFDNIKKIKDYRKQASDAIELGDYKPGSMRDVDWTGQLWNATFGSGADANKWAEQYEAALERLGDVPITFESILDEMIAIQQEKLGESEALFDQWIGDHLNQMVTGLALKDITIPTELVEQVKTALQTAFGPEMLAQFDTFGGIDAAIRGALTAMLGALQDTRVQEAVAGLTDSLAKAQQGFFLDEEAITANWDTVFGEGGPLMTAMMAVAGITPDAAKGIIELSFGLQGLGASAEVAVSGLKNTAAAQEESAIATLQMAESFDFAGATQKEGTEHAKTLLAAYKQLNDRVRQLDDDSKKLEKGQKALNKAKKDTKSLSNDESEALKDLAQMVGYQGDNYALLQNRVDQYGKALETRSATATAEVQWLTQELGNAAAASNIDAEVRVQTEEAYNNMSELEKLALALGVVLKGLGFGGGGSGRGGGGSRKKTKAELAEEARRAAEEARQEAIRQDYALLDHQKHMNQLTLEQELAMLHAVRQAHEMNAKEIMEWEERVYDLRQELRRRDAGSIDKAGDALIEALGARYEAMQEAEIQRLDASRKAWEDWRDDSVKAIRDQIAALDELSKTQDREKQDQEELRKIAKLRQDVEFEQDSYNRMKLQQQLDQAISSREDRLRRLDIQDQKDALNKQIEAIQDQAEAQFAVLDSEQEEIEKAYAERMKSAALQAEAEKLMMTGNQQEIISLIGEFAPQYDALGKTLGEKLLEGFQSKVGNVVAWFQGLNDSLYAIQQQAAAEAVAAANQFQAGQAQRQQSAAAANAIPPTTVVEQTVNFYEPVETAGEAAKRIRQANEELGALLYGG